MPESKERIIRRSLSAPRPTTDWSQFDAMTDSDIQAGIDADPDAAPIIDDAWLAIARVVEPDTKVPITIRLDRDVVSFFRDYGKGYQTRINKILRRFMEHEQANHQVGR